VADKRSANHGFNQRHEEVGRQIAAMWSSLGASRTLLSQVVQDRRLPQEEVLDAEQERQRGDAHSWRRVAEALAAEIVALADAVQDHRAALDRRDQPSGVERLIGRFFPASQRRLTRRRWERLSSLDSLGLLSRQADALHGLLTATRQQLQDERRRSESDLVFLAQYRSDLLEQVETAPDAAGRAEAVGVVEDAMRLFGNLAKTTNARVALCSIFLHKLSVETEELLIVYRVVADLYREQPTAETDLARLAYLGDACDRFRRGRLIGADLDRLRTHADAAFFAAFPAHAPLAEAPSRDAASRAAPGAPASVAVG
jgi:hypothetical protein